MNKVLTAALGAILLPAALSTPTQMSAETRQNPFMVPYDTPFEIPPFDKITYADYLPAIEKGIADKKKEIDAIANNPATPTFDNTILAMEKSGELLSRVMLVFGALDETDNNEHMLAISEKAYPMVSAASDEIMMNDKLFQRVKYLYDRRDNLGLDGAQKRAVELRLQGLHPQRRPPHSRTEGSAQGPQQRAHSALADIQQKPPRIDQQL